MFFLLGLDEIRYGDFVASIFPDDTDLERQENVFPERRANPGQQCWVQ